MTPFKPDQGYSAVLVIMDELTGQVHLAATTVNATAEQVVHQLEKEVMATHGLPLVLGTATTDHHVATVERVIRSVREQLRAVVDHSGQGWVNALPRIELSLNALAGSDGLSPTQRWLGYNVRVPLLGGGAPAPSVLEERQRVLAHAWLLDQYHTRKDEVAVQHNRGRVEDPLQVGDWVAVPAKLSGAAVAKHVDAVGAKGRPLYIGAYEVVAALARGNYQLRMPASQRNSNIFHTSVLRKVAPPTDVDARDPQRPKQLLWEDGTAKAKMIINSRVSRGVDEFLVLYWGQTDAAGEWVRRSALRRAEQHLVEAFLAHQRQHVPSVPRQQKIALSKAPSRTVPTGRSAD